MRKGAPSHRCTCRGRSWGRPRHSFPRSSRRASLRPVRCPRSKQPAGSPTPGSQTRQTAIFQTSSSDRALLRCSIRIHGASQPFLAIGLNPCPGRMRLRRYRHGPVRRKRTRGKKAQHFHRRATVPMIHTWPVSAILRRPSAQGMPWLHCRWTGILIREPRAGLFRYSASAEGSGGMLVRSRFNFRGPARSGLSCLVAWLLLVLVAPVPTAFSVVVGYPSESRGNDSAPEDGAPAENETPQDEDVPPETLLKGTRFPGRPEASSDLKRSPKATNTSPRHRLRGGRPGSFSALRDGRALRIRIRSLTC